MKGLRFRYFIVLLACLVSTLSEARNAKRPFPSAVVVGTVYCDTCFHQEFSQSSHFISGASVAIQCRDASSRRPAGFFRQVVKTNEHGEFRAHLPLSLSKHVKKIKGCSVKLISSSEPFCAVGSSATSSSLHLKSKKEGTHIFSAGFFTFRPLKQPEVCDQKPSLHSPKKLTAEKSIISDYPKFLPPIQEPPKSDLPPTGGSNLPPLPGLPKLPPLPQLPPLPSLPRDVPYLPPVPKTLSSPLSMKNVSPNQFPFLPPFLPPNPLLPPPSLLPPNPLLPPPSLLPPNPLLPPPSILPPNPFQPPPSIIPPVLPSPPPSLFPPLFPSPPPSLFPPVLPTPSPPSSLFPPIFPFPSSPPPPSSVFPPIFPFPGSPPPATSAPFLPPFPFQPTPGFPGVPPAVTVSTSTTSSSKKNIP